MGLEIAPIRHFYVTIISLGRLTISVPEFGFVMWPVRTAQNSGYGLIFGNIRCMQALRTMQVTQFTIAHQF